MIRKFAIKTLLADKVRTICTIIAMILTTLLFTALFTTFIGMSNTSRYYRVKQTGTLCHFIVKPWTSELGETLEIIRKNNHVELAGTRKFLAYAVNEELNYNVEVSYEDEAYANSSFHNLTEGRMPVYASEIVMDTTTMMNMGITKEIGTEVSLELYVGGSTVTEEFTVCGWYEMNRAFQEKTGQLIVSKEYIDIWEDEFNADALYGVEEIGIFLKNDKDIETQAKMILDESGAGAEVDNISVNPSYETEEYSVSGSNLILLVIGICIIILIGYLIINNIFYIAAKKDAKQYGQLKTIGMSNKQLAAFVKWQAGFLLIVAIPVGFVIGFAVGEVLLPIVLSQTNYDAVANDSLVGIGEMIVVLMFAGMFMLVTTVISVHGPIRMIRKLTPIESTHLELKNYRTQRKSSDGSKLNKFAFYNIARNRKSMVLLIISISLPLLLVSISYHIFNSFDMNKYLSSMIYSDYNVAMGSYYKGEYMSNEEENHALDKQIIDEIREAEFIENGGAVYGSCAVEDIEICGVEEDYWLNIYGLEKFNLNESLLMEEDIDLESFWGGNGIIEGCWLDEDGEMLQGTFQYNVGDHVAVEDVDGIRREYIVLGHINIGLGALDTGISGINTTYEFYLCPDQYSLLTHNQDIMSYAFDVKNGEEINAEKFMKNMINVNSEIDYQSKETLEEEFKSLQWLMEIIGIFLCGMLAFIALMNLVNVFVTSIIVREKEIATLRSIGMVRKQLRTMLIWEVSYYIVFAFAISTVLSVILSDIMIAHICNSISFLTFTMKWEIYLFILAGAFAVGLVTALMVENRINIKNISEQIKI